MKLPASSFQNKLMLSYLVIILIPVLSALFILGLDFYNQTKRSYEDIMNQLNKRTNLIVSDFFSNISRYSYFYLTDNRLKRILEKKNVQSNLEFIDDANYMQQAMDQNLLMNGQLVGISVTGVNGRVYSSTGANTGYLDKLLGELPADKLRKGKIIVTNAYESNIVSNQGKVVSVLRYLSDLDHVKGQDVYAKLDIKFKVIENLFGGISGSNSEVGTIVFAGDKLIYNTAEYSFDGEAVSKIMAQFTKGGEHENRLVQLTLGGEKYMFTATWNDITGWSIIQFIPSRVIDNAFSKNVGRYVSISVLCVAAAVALAVLFSRRLLQPIHNLIKAMKIVDSGSLDQMLADEQRKDEIGKLIQSYNVMIARLKESREKERRAGELQKQAEMGMLQAQINPHFLYNTLNTMHSIAELHRFEPISVMARSLSGMYRYNLKSKDRVTVRMELEQINNYIRIQQIRFVDKFDVKYEIDEAIADYRMLKFLLQPIVENSFHHGLEPKGGKGTLVLSVRKQGHTLHIKIQDDGVGMSERRLEELNRSLRQADGAEPSQGNRHIGLSNVSARIKNFYGEDYWLRITSRLHEGTCVEMLIPADKEEDTNENPSR
ncbi:sensor histidine kinase [Paenibacillus doosanensis]|uniref:Sensor histidine kinase YpdA n=1 Tax=Paenibacillus konkukensis TaxID=2020716 RepID=A0ABY4RHT3_9BACL|nr:MULTISPECIES: histidine kinase [Paenibacillus]MCS7463989.1 sensor histidine kinase [Paenibacillus doosanensis]UQZ81416.1 Sensor histidine kinase YpdA [Paenibacillus konkukensis]